MSDKKNDMFGDRMKMYENIETQKNLKFSFSFQSSNDKLEINVESITWIGFTFS